MGQIYTAVGATTKAEIIKKKKKKSRNKDPVAGGSAGEKKKKKSPCKSGSQERRDPPKAPKAELTETPCKAVMRMKKRRGKDKETSDSRGVGGS